MKLIHFLAFALSSCVGTPAMAQAYGELHGGLNIPNDVVLQMDRDKLTTENDDGYLWGGAVGYDFGALRVGIDYTQARATTSRIRNTFRPRTYNTNDWSDSYQLRRTLTLDAYLEHNLSDAVTIFAGGGAGISQITMRAKGGVDCREDIAMRIVDPRIKPKVGENGLACTDQGRSRDVGFTYKFGGGADFKMGKGWSIGPRVDYTTVNGIDTAGKSTPSRQTRFTGNPLYRSWNVSLGLTKRFGR